MSSHFVPTYTPPEITFVRGQGSWLYDTEQRQYLDCAGGVAVNALGHCAPELVAALQQQAQTLWHTSNWWRNAPAAVLAEQLVERTFAEQIFLCNSGAEANEAALKLARKHAYDHHGDRKYEIIACENAFHGRTLFALTAGGKYTAPFAPLPDGIRHIPFNDASALRAAVSVRTCAVIIEPIQGEGGVHCAHRDFLLAAREACDAHQALLIFDEIQSGMGRTGHLFHYMQHAVVPDILTAAKALGGGFPIGAMLTTKHVGTALSAGWHGSTFGGNPLAARVASTMLDAITPQLLTTVREQGVWLRSALEQLNQRIAFCRAVRGNGLLVGCELNADMVGSDLQQACLQQRLLVLLGDGGRVLRFAPPLNISRKELHLAIQSLEAALHHLSSR